MRLLGIGKLSSRCQAKVACRSYASIASGGRSGSSDGGSKLTLEHFIQRKRALQLWRSVVRAVYKIPTASSRIEMLTFARTEFERNRYVHDISHIRYLISTGKTQLDSMVYYIDQNVR